MTQPLIIDYYSDLLCVWAWIAQKRLDELNQKLSDKIEIHYHFINIFGDTQSKMSKQWASKGGYEGFSSHVIESAKPYLNAPVSSEIWSEVRPTTSANAHLILKAVELHYGKAKGVDIALVLRKAFFINAVDVSDFNCLYSLLESSGIDLSKIKYSIANGKAMAALMSDYQSAQQLGLKGSPTYIIDNGRQTLYGNVGYRVLLANIEEQLKRPINEASWC